MKLPPALAQTIAQQRARFDKLQQRERWLVGVGSVVVLITLLYLLIWEPVTGAHLRREEGLASARALAQRLEAASAELQQLRANSGGAGVDRSSSLLAAIDTSVKQSAIGKAPDRLQPEGDSEVKIWFEDVPFDALLRWVVTLQTRYGITAQTLDVERQSGVGLVDARLTLVRS